MEADRQRIEPIIALQNAASGYQKRIWNISNWLVDMGRIHTDECGQVSTVWEGWGIEEIL